MAGDALEGADRIALWTEARRRAWSYRRPAPPAWITHRLWFEMSETEKADWIEKTRAAWRSR